MSRVNLKWSRCLRDYNLWWIFCVKMNQIDVISKPFYPGHYTDAGFFLYFIGSLYFI